MAHLLWRARARGQFLQNFAIRSCDFFAPQHLPHWHQKTSMPLRWMRMLRQDPRPSHSATLRPAAILSHSDTNPWPVVSCAHLIVIVNTDALSARFVLRKKTAE